jgi:hypothetical protein
LLVSYGAILFSLIVLKGRKKIYPSAVPKLLLWFYFIVPCIPICAQPPTVFFFDKMVAIFYIILTPLLNPMINIFWNNEIEKFHKESVEEIGMVL